MSIENEETADKLLMFEVEDHAIECDESAEEDEQASQREEDLGEDEFSRIQQLFDDPVRLRPDEAFIARLAEHKTTIKKDDFRLRFIEFLKGLTPDIDEPSAEVCDGLFRLAVHAQQQLLAWEETVFTTKDKEFLHSRRFLRAKAKWLARMRKESKKQFRGAPKWALSWVEVWSKALDELQDLMAGQLRGAQKYLERLSQLSKLGRTDVCSHILLSNRDLIKEVIKKSPLSKTPVVAVAAFAHASKLLPQRDDANDSKGRHINRVKARLSRTARSKAQLPITSAYLQSLFLTSQQKDT